jgi:hypothetical protein
MQDISNVPILPNIKQNRGGVGQKCRYKRSRFLRTHVCGNKSSVHDVLYAKGKCFWMRVYEIQKVKLPKEEPFKT